VAHFKKEYGLFILSKNSYIKDYISIHKSKKIVSSILLNCCLESTVVTVVVHEVPSLFLAVYNIILKEGTRDTSDCLVALHVGCLDIYNKIYTTKI